MFRLLLATTLSAVIGAGPARAAVPLLASRARWGSKGVLAWQAVNEHVLGRAGESNPCGFEIGRAVVDAAWEGDVLVGRLTLCTACGERTVPYLGVHVAWAVGVAEVEEIDRLNIYHAGLLALRRALLGLPTTPTFVLVDARRIPECPVPQRGIVHGDALSLTIAAASIIAKTTRDAHMAELDARYPGYGFAAHKGYPTPQHETALRSLGACPVHRRSFAPVRVALGLEPIQELLFEPPPVPPEPSGP